MEFRAREKQPLHEHIEGTAQLAHTFASVYDCGNIGHALGLLHDLGKYTRAFQDYLQRQLAGDEARRGEVVHALQGAKYLLEQISDPFIADMLGNIIASHHGGLFDMITEGERTLLHKLANHIDDLNYQEALSNFAPNLDKSSIQKEFEDICKKYADGRFNPFFMLHLLTKALFSCLVDADRCNSAQLEAEAGVPAWQSYLVDLECYLRFVNLGAGLSDLDRCRKQISDKCKQAAARPLGVYTLSVPTGGGKTLSSLRFALAHAKEHKLKRIIYVIPYLSILDQTASRMRKALKGKNKTIILEHHSNIEPLEDEEERDKYRELTSRWDSPIILTTMVQFLESIYSNRASKLRKFHNMSESVIVFDEVQALPIKCIHLFNDAVNFLNHFAKSTVLLCTATQPQLDKVDRPIRLAKNHALVTLTPASSKAFERVRIVDNSQTALSYAQIAELAEAQIMEHKSVLIVLNTKRDAREVFNACKALELGSNRALLTTDLCPAHRMAVLKRLEAGLKSNQTTLCVSTQLIEAGVDISFGCVVRAKAGLDNIVQAAGRCNRNNEFSGKLKNVFVVDVEQENLSRLPEIAEAKRITTRVSDELVGVNLLSDQAMNLFYAYYFYGQKNKMDYVHEWSRDGSAKSTLYTLLDKNVRHLTAYASYTGQQYRGLPAAFKTAADAFSVIDARQIGVIVPYGEALRLVSDFQRVHSPKEKMLVLNKLQKYTVNVYRYQMELIHEGLKLIDDTFYLLSPDWYDEEELGLLTEPRLKFHESLME